MMKRMEYKNIKCMPF